LVGGKGFVKDFPDDLFRLPVRAGHGRTVNFLDHRDVFPEISEGSLPTFLGSLPGDGQEPL